MITPDGERILFCNWCGKKFSPPILNESRGRFDTLECYHAYRNNLPIGKQPREPITLVCQCGCGEQFTLDPKEGKDRKYKNREHASRALRGRTWTRNYTDNK